MKLSISEELRKLFEIRPGRPIKFRAWDAHDKKMLEWLEVQKLPMLTLEMTLGTPFMQFTGLLDSKGKEIYEGDIVKRSKSYEVIWLGYGWWLRNIKDGASFPIGRYEVYEIIGNIYESSGLLS